MYSNPSNWFWRILKTTGIAPEHIRGAEVRNALARPCSSSTDLLQPDPNLPVRRVHVMNLHSTIDGF